MAPKPAPYTPEQLANLTEEEREGLLDPDFLDDEGDDQADDDAGEAADDDAEPAKAAAAPADPGPLAAPDPLASPDDDDDSAATDDDDTADPSATDDAGDGAQVHPEAVRLAAMQQQETEARAKLAEIDKSLDDLATKFDEAEITAAEYRSQVRTLENERWDLRHRADRAADTYQSRIETFVNETVAGFVAANPMYRNKTLFTALDEEVRRIQETGRYDPLSLEVIEAAHENLIGAMNIAAAPAAGAPAPAPKRDAKPPKRPASAMPPSISRLPAAGAQDIDDSKFTALDRLKGVEYERALARLSPADRDEYLQR